MEISPWPKNQQTKTAASKGQTDVHSEMFQISTLLQYLMIKKNVIAASTFDMLRAQVASTLSTWEVLKRKLRD